MPQRELVLDPRVLDAVKRARDVPSVPAVVIEVLKVARDENAGAEELARVVSLDAALSAKILKVSNSALFRTMSEIVTVKRACSQLGFRTVRLWALSFAMVDSLQRPETDDFDCDEYWRRTVVRAVSAKLVAEAVRPKVADEAFITGLLSRIGRLLLAGCLPNEYQALMAASSNSWPTADQEREILGYTSDQLGVALLHSWNLPALVYEAVLCAEDESMEKKQLPANTIDLARILRLAGYCEQLIFGDPKSKALVRLHNSAKKFFDLEPERIEELLANLEESTREISSILSVHTRAGVDIPEVLRRAQLDMLRETIALLHDAVTAEQRAAQLQCENSLLLMKAQTDALTGLADRGTFDEALQGCALGGPEEPRTVRVGLLMIDVDGFKEINDTYGHPAGDRVLQMIARTLRNAIREDDLAARYGGDEFVVVLPRTTVEGLRRVGERIRSEVEKKRFLAGSREISATVSVGGAHSMLFDPPLSPTALVEMVDQCLYAAKEKGRNRCEFVTARPNLAEVPA